jgi:hypothetical protein
MRYIVMHKVDLTMEAGVPPDHEVVMNMGRLVGQSLKQGIFIDGAGLHRSARRVRLHCKAGRCDVERGPYQGENELVACMALIRTDSIDAAVAQAQRYGAALGDAEIEIGPLVEPWDLTGSSKPADVEGEQFLLLFKGDPAYERGQAIAPERAAAVAHLDHELASKRVLLKRHHIAPSSTGKRLAGPEGKRTWTDGPFLESKELIAGFSIVEVRSLADAISWAGRYAAILVGNQIDVRQIAG